VRKDSPVQNDFWHPAESTLPASVGQRRQPRSLPAMKNCLFDRPPVTQVLDDDAFEQLRRHPRVPDSVRIHRDDGPSGADAQTWCLAALHSPRPEEQALALQEIRQELIQETAATVGRAEGSSTDEHVS
jgi:hypothetical protein